MTVTVVVAVVVPVAITGAIAGAVAVVIARVVGVSVRRLGPPVVAAVLTAVPVFLLAAGAGVAERRVEPGHPVGGVAAGVDRYVDRNLKAVAGQDARRILGSAAGVRIGQGGAAAQGQNARRGGRRDHSLTQGLSQSRCLPA
jgi:hypothetical protein